MALCNSTELPGVGLIGSFGVARTAGMLQEECGGPEQSSPDRQLLGQGLSE